MHMQISTQEKNPLIFLHTRSLCLNKMLHINTLTMKKNPTPALWFNWQDSLSRCSSAGQGYCLMVDHNKNVLFSTGQKNSNSA